MNEYTFTLDSDQGPHKIKILGSCIESAVIVVTTVQGCPESAIKNIKIKSIL